MIYDSAIFVPITTTAGHITGTKYYSSIAISVTDKEKVLEKQAEIDILLKDRLKIIDKDSLPYKLSNQQQLLDYVEETMSTMTTLLAYIAAISLIV
jgi:ABC-type antimicrobial peptide transport system permease subunit